MKMFGGPASINIKVTLLLVAIFIAGATLFYTQNLVQQLQKKEREIVQLYAKGIEYIANSSDSEADLTFLFENIIKPIDFPLISLMPTTASTRQPERTSGILLSILQKQRKNCRLYFVEKIKEMDASHNPILVTYQDSIILQKIHYGDSELISRLKFILISRL